MSCRSKATATPVASWEQSNHSQQLFSKQPFLQGGLHIIFGEQLFFNGCLSSQPVVTTHGPTDCEPLNRDPKDHISVRMLHPGSRAQYK